MVALVVAWNEENEDEQAIFVGPKNMNWQNWESNGKVVASEFANRY